MSSILHTAAEKQDHLEKKPRLRILLLPTGRVEPSLICLNAVFVPPLSPPKIIWQSKLTHIGCSEMTARETGNRGWWIQSRDGLGCLCCATDGSPCCSAQCPSVLMCCPNLHTHRSICSCFPHFVFGDFSDRLSVCWIVFSSANLVFVLFCFHAIFGIQGLRI